jgi:hypothetical protein
LHPDKPHPTIAAANNIYKLRIIGALFNYLNKAFFVPTKSALLKAVKKFHLNAWTGQTEEAINKHLKMTPATEMGKINQKCQSIHSTTRNKIWKVKQ